MRLSASAVTSDVVQEVIIEPEPLEITEPTETESTDSPPLAEQQVAMTSAVTIPNFMAAVSGDAVKPPATPSKEAGEGKGKADEEVRRFRNQAICDRLRLCHR